MRNKNAKNTLPELLRFTDPGVREQLEALPASQVLIGVGGDGQPVCFDLDSESLHVLVCSASGGGTSTTLRTLAAQLMHHGAHALVLDLKRGLPAVGAWPADGDVPQQHRRHPRRPGRRLRTELKHRMGHVDQHGGTDDLPWLTVVFEGYHGRRPPRFRRPGPVPS